MKAGLARNLRLLADLITTSIYRTEILGFVQSEVFVTIVQRGFAAVHGHADSILFEIGSPNRRQQFVFRDSALRIEATLRTLFLVEIAICQYRTQVIPGTRPVQVGNAQQNFDRTVADRLRRIATAVDDEFRFPQSLRCGTPTTNWSNRRALGSRL